MVRVMEHVWARDVPIELGPGERAGANGPMESVYVRDPDGNLLELSRRRTISL